MLLTLDYPRVGTGFTWLVSHVGSAGLKPTPDTVVRRSNDYERCN